LYIVSPGGRILSAMVAPAEMMRAAAGEPAGQFLDK
jgi:hypothetical protein